MSPDDRRKEIYKKAGFIVSDMARLEATPVGGLDGHGQDNLFGQMRALQAQYDALAKELEQLDEAEGSLVQLALPLI